MATEAEPTVVVIRPSEQTTSHQGVAGFVGVSGDTAGCTGISMKLVVIPTGGKAVPHKHVGYETAIFTISGEVETRYGPGLRQSVVTGPGDFLFIPAGVAHQPVNIGSVEARAVVARNDPAEAEHVQDYDPTSE